MSLEIVTIPCLEDNYAFLLHDSATGKTAAVDVPDSGPILAVLEERGWDLDEIWLTHHHDDHIDGVPELRTATGAKVTGAAADAHRLPPLDRQVNDEEVFDFAGHPVRVIDVSFHTIGHIAFYVADAKAVFSADSLMALGCGRIFEGNAEQGWQSLSKLAALPPDTLVCSGHEYTLSNARFAMSVDAGNPALQKRMAEVEQAVREGRATVPSLLSEELATNPFLRATSAEMKRSVGMENAKDWEVFAEVRKRKDNF